MSLFLLVIFMIIMTPITYAAGKAFARKIFPKKPKLPQSVGSKRATDRLKELRKRDN